MDVVPTKLNVVFANNVGGGRGGGAGAGGERNRTVEPRWGGLKSIKHQSPGLDNLMGALNKLYAETFRPTTRHKHSSDMQVDERQLPAGINTIELHIPPLTLKRIKTA